MRKSHDMIGRPNAERCRTRSAFRVPRSAFRTPRSAFRIPRSAFTLTELLVVIGIMVLLMGIGAVGYKAMFSGRRIDTAVNTISAAAGATRAFVGRDSAFLIGSDSGVALVFTPANEVRMTRNAWDAKDGSAYLETSSLNGYDDMPDVPYFQIPKGVGVVAITRNDNTAAKFLAPPFALRFDKDGHLACGDLVYYDAGAATATATTAYDGKYDTTSRTAAYNPAEWDPDEDAAYAAGQLKYWNSRVGKMELPFETIETVVGVMVYDKVALKAAGFNLAAGSGGVVNNTATTWIRANGTPIFFNRYTGAAVKER